MILCFDNYMPVSGQSVIAQGEQSFLVQFRQGGVVDVETEMDGT